MWVQLITSKTIYIEGETRRFEPGDWINVGKSLGLRMLELKEARTTDITKLDIFESGSKDKGVFFAGSVDRGKSILGRFLGPANWSIVEPIFRWNKVMYWDASVTPALEVIPVAWDLLDRGWEVIAPLLDYDTMAKDIGTPEDRRLTGERILDLRVPVYDTRVLFLRDCPAARDLMDRWAAESGDRRLAFMRALWDTKPLIMSVPKTWANGKAHDREHWLRK